MKITTKAKPNNRVLYNNKNTILIVDMAPDQKSSKNPVFI
jgi:hypothetical protein